MVWWTQQQRYGDILFLSTCLLMRTTLGFRAHYTNSEQRAPGGSFYLPVQNLSPASARSSHPDRLYYWKIWRTYSRDSRSIRRPSERIRFMLASLNRAIACRSRCRGCRAHCYLLRWTDTCGAVDRTLRWPGSFGVCHSKWRTCWRCSWRYASRSLCAPACWRPIWSS